MEQLEIDGESVPLPRAVLRHFRDVRNIRSLRASVRVDILRAPFRDRAKYKRGILKHVLRQTKGSLVVLLDPDTGLESKHPGLEHVLESEVVEVWRAMRSGDVLVFYQNQTNKKGLPWIEPKRRQFERAMRPSPPRVKVARAPKVARDVAFFFSRKDR